jgi:hypothetical protein
MRKTKKQTTAERLKREALRMQERERAAEERKALREKQQAERDELRERQAQRRKDNATTNAGGFREGAGRPPKDDQERETFTFYGTHNEREKVRNLLRVLRAMEQDQQKAFSLFYKLNGMAAYDLLTCGHVANPAQRQIVVESMPELLEDTEDRE